MPNSSAGDRDSSPSLLETLAQEFVERFRRGERPALSEYTGRHPDLAADIRALFPTMAMLEGVRPVDTLPYLNHPVGTGGAPPEKLGEYRILREVGRGGMGIVYEAEDTTLGRRVALKVLPAQMVRHPRHLLRFQSEARAAARLHHTNIVPVFGVGESDGLHYYIMQFIHGQGLDLVLEQLAGTKAGPRETGPQIFPHPSREQGAAYWKSVARIGIHVAEALAHAHAQGTLHRDIKPSNILLDSQGVAWVTDFGLAKVADSDDLTPNGDIVGTVRYMAPERFQGKGDARSDVCALGLTLYELLTLRPAFDQLDTRELLYQVANVEPRPPRKVCPAVPRDLETIVLKAIARDPKQRYQSAAELADDLRRFADDAPIRARAMHWLERLGRWCRRNPWPSYLLLAILLTAGVGFWHLCSLSASLMRFSALRAAALQSEMFDEVNDFYSAQVVDRAKRSGTEASEHYACRHGTIPTPATFTIDLGQQISRHNDQGLEVRLYSDFPFPSRKNGGPRDDFEREALKQLRASPGQPFYRFEQHQGRPTLRYATARRMKESCVKCHNSHPESPRTDWQVGDVRGVLEIIHPLDRDVRRTSEGLRGSFLLMAGMCAVLLLCCGVVLGVCRHRNATGNGA
jgi:serine/threonine protein kinase